MSPDPPPRDAGDDAAEAPRAARGEQGAVPGHPDWAPPVAPQRHAPPVARDGDGPPAPVAPHGDSPPTPPAAPHGDGPFTPPVAPHGDGPPTPPAAPHGDGPFTPPVAPHGDETATPSRAEAPAAPDGGAAPGDETASRDVKGIAAAASADEPPPLGAALGGPLGIAESVLPSAAFVLTYTITGQQTEPSVGVAVALGAVFAVARVARGQTPQFAIAGLAGLALSAYVVSRTGRAEDFFLPGLLANAAYALAYAISIIVRWPLLGVIVAAASQRSMDWRDDPEQIRAYSRASWIWVALFSLRLAVQLPLYLAGAVVALGVARVAMGIPLFVVGIWLSWLLLRKTAALGPRRHA